MYFTSFKKGWYFIINYYVIPPPFSFVKKIKKYASYEAKIMLLLPDTDNARKLPLT